MAVVLSTQEYARVYAQNWDEFLHVADRVSQQAKAQRLTTHTLDEILADEH